MFLFYIFIVIAIILLLVYLGPQKKEAFVPLGQMEYPKLGDAFKNSWYDTFGKECKKYKCKIWNGFNHQYFCSNNTCSVNEQNLQGERMKNMSWFERYI